MFICHVKNGNLNEFETILSDISMLFMKCNGEYVSIAGDINTNFIKKHVIVTIY